MENLVLCGSCARQSTQTALAQSHLALLKGDSYVRSSAAIEGDKTSVTEPANIHAFSIVPNPAQQYVSIYNTAPANTPCYIYSIEGGLVKTALINGTTRIDVSQLHAGLYYCKLLGVQQVEKLIIVK